MKSYSEIIKLIQELQYFSGNGKVMKFVHIKN